MAKLLLVQTLFLTICWFALVSGDIQDEEGFKTFIKDEVIKNFRSWAQSSKNDKSKEQFAVLMLMDSDRNWNKFKFSPELPNELDTNTNVIPKDVADMVNYVAVKPGKTQIRKKEKFLHSEQRIYEKFLDRLLLNYHAMKEKEKKKKTTPEAIVLYSWIVPCFEQSCPSQGTKGCTSHTIQQLGAYAKKVKVIVAYTTNGGGMKGKTKCNAQETENQLKAAGIDVLKINYNGKEEAIIEGLEKLGRLLETLE